MSDVKERKRQPKGVPVGGEFAANEHDEASAELVGGSPFGTDAHERINSTPIKERVKIAHEELEAAVAALDQDDNWQKHLNDIAHFRSYSFTNSMLIGLQFPEATKVNSFNRWKELGRTVTKGSKAITIFAPMFRKEEKDDGTEERKLFGFKAVSVFDVSQTEGEPLAETWKELSEEPRPGYVEDLHSAIEDQGFAVEYRDMSKEGGARGYTSFSEKKVVIDSSKSAGTQATVLAHELGHIACGHGEQSSTYHTGVGGERGRQEVEAESFAYTLSRINGMESHSKPTSEYIAGWSRKDPSELTKAGETVAKSIKKIFGDGSGWRNSN